MSSPQFAVAEEPFPRLSPFESIFIRTVLEHRGLGNQPTLAEFAAALQVLRRYDQQCQDNPPEDGHWVPRIDDDKLAALRAKVFVMFGATKPSPAQWQKAGIALFGPRHRD